MRPRLIAAARRQSASTEKSDIMQEFSLAGTVTYCQQTLARTEERIFLKYGAGSGGRRNTCLQSTCRSLEAQGHSGTLIQAQRDLVELRL